LETAFRGIIPAAHWAEGLLDRGRFSIRTWTAQSSGVYMRNCCAPTRWRSQRRLCSAHPPQRAPTRL